MFFVCKVATPHRSKKLPTRLVFRARGISIHDIINIVNNKNGDKIMYQINVNGILLPTIYWSLREAMEACAAEKARGFAVFTEIVSVG